MSKEPQEPTVDFESAMNRLDTIARQLESGDVPLEKAMQLFEEGLELSNRCGALLEKAQQRIDKLLEGRDGGEERQAMRSKS
jgi:exodeoxyribonuclease VII small subunit